MGDPKKHVSKFSGPRHPWEATRLGEEKILLRSYGLKNKKDIWKQVSLVKKIKSRVKRINASVGQTMAQEREDLIRKLLEFNLLQEGQALEEALNLTVEDVMERRLQTQVVRSNLAKTMSQARQFIVHGHIIVDGKKITSPSYQINRQEQFKIAFVEKSSLADEEHPERKAPEVVPKAEDKSKTPEEELAAADEEVSKEIGEKIDADVDVDEESSEKKEDDTKDVKAEKADPAKVKEDKKDE